MRRFRSKTGFLPASLVTLAVMTCLVGLRSFFFLCAAFLSADPLKFFVCAWGNELPRRVGITTFDGSDFSTSVVCQLACMIPTFDRPLSTGIIGFFLGHPHPFMV